MDFSPATTTAEPTGTGATAPAAASTRAKRPRITSADLGPMRPNRLQRLGGLGLIAAPLLFTGGMLTSPQQTGPGTAGYIESLAADPALSL